jgi:hypothetical protein
MLRLGQVRSYFFGGHAAIWRTALALHLQAHLDRRSNLACTGCRMLAGRACIVQSVGCVVHVCDFSRSLIQPACMLGGFSHSQEV